MKSFHNNWSSDLDQSGIYYTVDGRRFLNKIEALIYANGDPNRVIFHYLTHVWRQHDWTQEPSESISSMIDRRCRQIRDSHDYVALWYSGGYDSQTVLDSFLRQNLVVDEILVYKRDYLLEWSASAEQDAALNMAHHIKQHYWPNLTVREVWYRPEHLIDFYRSHKDDWILMPGFQGQVSKATRPFLFNYNSNFCQLVKAGRADVEGREKPRLWIENGWWCAVGMDSVSEYQMDSHSVQFYTTADMPELEIKQTWMMINWIESMNMTTVQQVHQYVNQLQSHVLGAKAYQQWNRAVGRSDVRSFGSYVTVVDGTKNWYRGDVTDILECRDLKRYLQTKHPDVWQIYSNGIQQIRDIVPAIFDDQNRIRTLFSERIPIKPVEPGRLCDES